MSYKEYKVGQEYAFVRFDYVRAAKRIGGFNPVLDEVERLHIETLECVEERLGAAEEQVWIFLDRFGELWRSQGVRKDNSMLESVMSIEPLENERMRELLPRQKLGVAFDLAFWLVALQKTAYAALARGLDEDEPNWEAGIEASGRLFGLMNAVCLTVAFHLGVLVEIDESAKNISLFKLTKNAAGVEDPHASRLSKLYRQVNASDFALEVMKKITIV